MILTIKTDYGKIKCVLVNNIKGHIDTHIDCWPEVQVQGKTIPDSITALNERLTELLDILLEIELCTL